MNIDTLKKGGLNRIIVSVALFSLGFLLCAVSIDQWSMLKDFAPSLATLLAAFFGVWFAYRLQLISKEKSEHSEKVAAANSALFTIFQRVNTLKLIQRDFVDPFRDNPDIHIGMQPILNLESFKSEIDFDKLKFLLNTDHSKILFDLHIENQRYKTTVEIIEFRSNLHLNQVQPLLHRAGIKEKQYYTLDDFRRAIGPLLYTHLEKATKDLVYNLDKTINSYTELKDRFRTALNSMFPDDKFLDFFLLEDENPTNHSS